MSVQNTLQGILSQKVVQNGSGYSVHTDIVNVDNITTTGTISTTGAILTTQPVNCDSIIFRPGSAGEIYSRTGTGVTTGAGVVTMNNTDINLNGNQIINDSGTLSHLGNIDMHGKIISDSTASQTTATVTNGISGIKFGNHIDLNGHLILNTGIGHSSSYNNYITLGGNLDLNSYTITSSNGGDMKIGTDITLNNHNIHSVASIGLSSSSTQAGTITVSGTSGTATSTGVLSSSIVIVTPTSDIGSGIRYWVTTNNSGTITITTSSSVSVIFNYFIAKY
jgi:hypothetical protein